MTAAPRIYHVGSDGRRPGGWTDGYDWRDPSPAQWLLSVPGRRTRPEPCECGGTVIEYQDPDESYCMGCRTIRPEVSRG